MEQGAQKVEQIRRHMSGKEEDRVAAFQEQVRALKAKDRSGRKISCRTFTCPTCEQGKCQGKKVICLPCEQTGHFKVAPACSTHFKNKTKSYQVELRGHAQLLRTQTVK